MVAAHTLPRAPVCFADPREIRGMSEERREIAGLTCAGWHPGGDPTVLALHGLTSTSQVWRGFAEALPQAQVIAPDLPGRGGKTLPALRHLSTPVHVIVAAHGKDDRAKPFISDRALALGHTCLPRMTSERVGGNHLTTLFDPAAPAAV